jgi:hypothetical protein
MPISPPSGQDINPRNDNNPRMWVWVLGAITVAAFVQPPGLPLAEMGMLIFGLLAIIPSLRHRQPPLPPPPLLLACMAGWIALSLCRGATSYAWKDVLQACFVLCAVPVLAHQITRRTPAAWLPVAITLGTGLSLGFAVLQLILGTPVVNICGLAANRPLYGVLSAGAAPLVLAWLRTQSDRLQRICIPLYLGLSILTILYLPALLLFTVVVLIDTFLNRRQRYWLLAPITLVLLAIVVASGITPQRRWLQQSVARVDAQGHARRWTVEWAAARAALADAPILGHGPGNYQSIVSGAQYKAGLPLTAEDRVDPGTQCGYLTLAVTSGLPAAFLFALAIISLAVRARRVEWSLRLTVWTLLPAMAITPLLVQGAGVWLGLLVGVLAGKQERLKSNADEKQNWIFSPALLLRGGLVCIGLISGGLMLHLKLSSKDQPPASIHGIAVLLSANDATVTSDFILESTPAAKSILRLVNKDKPSFLKASPVNWTFFTEKAGKHQIWLRTWWRDGCSNSLRIGIDKHPTQLVGNDGTYQTWHWVRGPMVQLSSGQHSLQLLPSEPGIKIHQIALSTESDFYPDGILSSCEASINQTKKPPSQLPNVTKWQTASTMRPFLAATGGAYRPGPEAFFSEMGIPCVRLEESQLDQIDELRKYDLVYLVGPWTNFPHQNLFRALLQYVEEGGTLILEKYPETKGTELELKLLGKTVKRHWRPVKVEGDDSILFRNGPKSATMHKDISISPLLRYGEAETFGKVSCRGRDMGPAILRKRIGAGTVWIPVAPLAFSSMWRNRKFDPIAHAMIREAIGKKFVPLYDRIRRPALPPSSSLFADDFMRSGEKLGDWNTVVGSFHLTGANPANPADAFQCRTDTPGRLATSNPNWINYALSASVKGNKAGIWLMSGEGRELSLFLEGSSVVLEETKGKITRELARTALTGNQTGWHRLSLFSRNGSWQGFVDGVRRLSVPATSQAQGKFGLVAGGTAKFDDVSVTPTANLQPDTDRAWGEEGSSLSRTPTDKGFEPRTVYNSSWYMMPDEQGKKAVQLGLPLLRGGYLTQDGHPIATVDAASEPPKIHFPTNLDNTHDMQLICHGWRDYMFGTQITDWYGTEADWMRLSRWSCSPQWTWLGVHARKRAVLWFRHTLRPNFAFVIYAAASAEARHPREAGRDLNLILGGNGSNIDNALTIRVGSGKSEGCELRRNGKVLARFPKLGLPRGHALHHRWFELKVFVEPKRIRFFYERQLVFDQALVEPLPTGYVGFWTERNSVRIARATLILGKDPE